MLRWGHTRRRTFEAIDKPLKWLAYVIHVNCRLLTTVAGAQQPKAIRSANIRSLIDDQTRRATISRTTIQSLFHTKVVPMSRITALRLTSDGRLLGFDTGDWSMLLGGFVLAGLLTLFV
jgi:hypothetical protein